MKKIILILFSVFILSCDIDPAEDIIETIDYWAEIITSQTDGTTETEFTFTVDTNDESTSLYSNGEILESSRSDTSYNFESGRYEIKAITENGAEDSVFINVSELPIRFVINKNPSFDDRTGGTIVNIEFPMLIRDGVEYNIETMTEDVSGLPVRASNSETERVITVDMDIEFGTDGFLFRDSNMLVRFDFLLTELNISNMITLVTFLNYVEPIPTFDSVLFNLSGTEGIADILVLTEDSYLINGVETSFIDASGVQVDTVKTIDLSLIVGSGDSFLFRNDGMMTFFNMGITDLTKEDVLKVVEILNMHEGSSNILDCVYRFYPENPILDNYVYGVDYE